MSSFVKDFLTTGAGNALTQLISIATIPIITRLYSPAEYGIYAAAFSLSMIIAPLLALRYNAALLIPKLPVNTSALLWLSCLTGTGVGALLIITGGVAITTNFYQRILGASASTTQIWWLAAITIIPGISLNFQMLAIKERRFSTLSFARILEIGLDRIYALGSGVLGAALATNLMMARAIGTVGASLVLVARNPNSIKHRPNWRRIRKLAVRYRAFPLSSTPASLIDALGRQLPIVVMTAYLSPFAIGCYALALQIVNMPLVLLGDALSNVYLNRAANHKSQPNYIATLSIPIIKITVLCFIPFALFMNSTGVMIFGQIFGAKWSDAGHYAAITALAIGIMFLHRILSSLFEVFEKTKLRLWFDLLLFVIKLGGVWLLCATQFAPETIIAYITGCNFLIYLAGIYYIYHYILNMPVVITASLRYLLKLFPILLIPLTISLFDLRPVFQAVLWLGIAAPFFTTQLTSEYLALKGK